jgi:hypothetical protein
MRISLFFSHQCKLTPGYVSLGGVKSGTGERNHVWKTHCFMDHSTVVNIDGNVCHCSIASIISQHIWTYDLAYGDLGGTATVTDHVMKD